ncbi:hypothetical protein BH11CYA1_BH11CYA1_26130 [soil metagenome]
MTLTKSRSHKTTAHLLTINIMCSSLPKFVAIVLLYLWAQQGVLALEGKITMTASETAFVKQLAELRRAGSYRQISETLKTIKPNEHSLEFCLKVPGAATAKSHNIKAVVDFITNAIKVYPASERLYLKRAETWLKVDESELALPDIKQAIALNPRLPEAHSDLAEFLRNLQKYKEAIVEVDRAIACGGPKDKLYDQKAEMLVQLFQIKAAEQAYREAIKNSDASRAWQPRQHLARMYSGSKRYSEGLAEWTAMAGKEPNSEQRIEMAVCLIGLGRYQEALNILNAEFPEEFNLNSHRLKKQCFVALKDPARAKQQDEIIAKLSADF